MGLCCPKPIEAEVLRPPVQPQLRRPVVVTCAPQPQTRPAQPTVPPPSPVRLRPSISITPSVRSKPSWIDPPPPLVSPPPSVCPPPPVPSQVSPIMTIKKQNTDEQKASKEEHQRLLHSQQEITRDDKILIALRQGLHLQQNAPLGNACVVVPVPEGTSGYHFVMRAFNNRKFQSTYQIIRVDYIHNPYLSAQYALKKFHIAGTFGERYLFHGTSYKAAMEVAKYNFDWRLVQNKRFGWGVSFANNPWYASHYSKRHRQLGTNYIMILAQLLVEPGQLRMGDERTVIPSIGHTTTNHSGEVLVKYDDGTFYPEYIVHFIERRHFY